MPSASTAPSVWKAEAEAPQRKPGGNIGRVIAASSSRAYERNRYVSPKPVRVREIRMSGNAPGNDQDQTLIAGGGRQQSLSRGA
ncbi:hypothetical protein SCMC78_12030 [Streptomyces sp. CMC78]|uniref:Uncharacterized protein n=1 Tax=Streptomyces sp. CMC78 TaxID=3231512 RepID=A0AB33K7H3_9ACTN|nr:hypothetical protein GCM10010504_21250 [Streptomyces griseus]